MKIEVGREYLSRRGERVVVTAIEPQGRWPVRFEVLSGRYKGVGVRDGSRLTLEGRSQLGEDGSSLDHGNDLVAYYPGSSNEPTTDTTQSTSDAAVP